MTEQNEHANGEPDSAGVEHRSVLRRAFSIVVGQAGILAILLFLNAPFLFFQEFRKEAEGIVSTAEHVKGAYDLSLSNGSSIYWIVRPLRVVSPGDRIKKERGSFRYAHNGEQVMQRRDAMVLLLKLPPKVMFLALGTLIGISFFYYVVTKEMILLDVCRRNVDRRVSLVCLGILPLLFLCYLWIYLMMGHWT